MSVPFSVPFPPSLPPLGNEMPIIALSAISQTPSYPRDYFLLALCPGPCICIPKSPSLSYLFPCWLPIASISNLCSSLGLHLPQWKPTFVPSLPLLTGSISVLGIIFPPCANAHGTQIDPHLEPSYLNSTPPPRADHVSSLLPRPSGWPFASESTPIKKQRENWLY